MIPLTALAIASTTSMRATGSPLSTTSDFALALAGLAGAPLGGDPGTASAGAWPEIAGGGNGLPVAAALAVPILDPVADPVARAVDPAPLLDPLVSSDVVPSTGTAAADPSPSVDAWSVALPKPRLDAPQILQPPAAKQFVQPALSPTLSSLPCGDVLVAGIDVGGASTEDVPPSDSAETRADDTPAATNAGSSAPITDPQTLVPTNAIPVAPATLPPPIVEAAPIAARAPAIASTFNAAPRTHATNVAPPAGAQTGSPLPPIGIAPSQPVASTMAPAPGSAVTKPLVAAKLPNSMALPASPQGAVTNAAAPLTVTSAPVPEWTSGRVAERSASISAAVSRGAPEVAPVGRRNPPPNVAPLAAATLKQPLPLAPVGPAAGAVPSTRILDATASSPRPIDATVATIAGDAAATRLDLPPAAVSPAMRPATPDIAPAAQMFAAAMFASRQPGALAADPRQVAPVVAVPAPADPPSGMLDLSPRDGLAAVNVATPRVPDVAPREAPMPNMVGAVEFSIRRDDAGEAAAPIIADPLPVTTLSTSPLAAPVAVAVPAPASLAGGTLDLGRGDWMASMIDRIDTLRSEGGEIRETRMKLAPDALGNVEISIRRDEAGELQVRIAADTPQARTILAEAAPRLADMAEARGVRLGGASVDAGSGSATPDRRDAQPHAATPARTPRPVGSGAPDITTTDSRIA